MIPLLTRLTLHHKPNKHYMLLTKSAVNEIWNSFDLHFKEESYDLFTYGLLCTQYYTTYARKSFSSLPAEINATQSLNFLLPVDEFVDKLSPMPGIQTRNELFKKLCVICTSNHINLQANSETVSSVKWLRRRVSMCSLKRTFMFNYYFIASAQFPFSAVA